MKELHIHTHTHTHVYRNFKRLIKMAFNYICIEKAIYYDNKHICTEVVARTHTHTHTHTYICVCV